MLKNHIVRICCIISLDVISGGTWNMEFIIGAVVLLNQQEYNFALADLPTNAYFAFQRRECTDHIRLYHPETIQNTFKAFIRLNSHRNYFRFVH